MEQDSLPLKGILVLDMSLYLAGPYAALRLQDLGARVIKIERPDGGDPCRALYKEKGAEDSLLFHTINRGKESITLDLKEPKDRDVLFQIIEHADVIIQNYRPGVAERLGLGYEDIEKVNPKIVFAGISGYGPVGPWAHLPGQDLLAQARSGIMWLSGNADDYPTPSGFPLADMFAGAIAVQGILSALVGRGVTGRGRKVETSLLEGLTDLQFELLTGFLNNGWKKPVRTQIGNANAYAPAPYGVYKTRDSFLTIAMTPLKRLAELVDVPSICSLHPQDDRDRIKSLLADKLVQHTTSHWLSILEPADIWCAEVLDWPQLLQSSQFKELDMLQTLHGRDNFQAETTRVPLRLNGKRPMCGKSAPQLGGQSDAIRAEFIER